MKERAKLYLLQLKRAICETKEWGATFFDCNFVNWRFWDHLYFIYFYYMFVSSYIIKRGNCDTYANTNLGRES